MLQQQLTLVINNLSLKVCLSKIRTVLHLSLLLNKSKKAPIFIEIPRFCFHPKLPIAGNCRMCLIELFKAPKLVVACTTRVQEGMVIFTNSLLVKKAREYLLEFFLANHPLDCPICDQGGECDLQNQLEVFGLDHTRYTENIKKVSKVINIGVVSFQMTRCIQCTRCVRFLTNVANITSLGIISRGNQMKISKYIKTYLFSEFLSNIVDLCPVGSLKNQQAYSASTASKKNISNLSKTNFNIFFCGALTITNSAYRTRSWELYSKYTIDILDNIGADIRIDLKGTDLIRVLPRINSQVNDHWITEITRYAIHGLKVQRLLLPFYKKNINKYVSTTWSTALDIYAKYISICDIILKKRIQSSGVVGNLSDGKTALSFTRFMQHKGSALLEARAYQNQEHALTCASMFSLNATTFNQSSIFFFIGVNLRLEAPFYNLKLKKKKDIIIFTCGSNFVYSSSMRTQNVQFINMGTHIKTIVKLFEGRTLLTNYLKQQLHQIQGPLLFILGIALCQRKDINNIIQSINYFSFFIKKIIYINTIQPHLGRITAHTLNIRTGRSVLNNNNTLCLKKGVNLLKNALNIIYNLSVSDLKPLTVNLNRYNTFQVYMGHTVTPQATHNLDLLLPICTFLEKETVYLNIEGVLRASKIVVAPYVHSNVLPDWQLYFLFIKKQNLLQQHRKVFFFAIIKKINILYKLQKSYLYFTHWLLYLKIFFNKLFSSQLLFSSQKTKGFLRQFSQSHLLIMPLYLQKYVQLRIFAKTLFNVAFIEPYLERQLLTFSRLFSITYQYSSQHFLNLQIKQIFFQQYFYLINYPVILKYRKIFDDNIISKNTPDIIKIKNNLVSLATNYLSA